MGFGRNVPLHRRSPACDLAPGSGRHPRGLESDTGDLLWISTSAFKSSRVLVPEAFVERAHAVIESHAAEEELAAQAAAEQVSMVTARYKDGVFTPLEPVDWEEGAEVEVRLLNSSKPGADH